MKPMTISCSVASAWGTIVPSVQARHETTENDLRRGQDEDRVATDYHDQLPHDHEDDCGGHDGQHS